MKPGSQDTGLAVLVRVVRAARWRGATTDFSVKEKDETRPMRVCGWESLNTFILALPEFEGFLFFILETRVPAAGKVRRGKRQQGTGRSESQSPSAPRWSLSETRSALVAEQN